MKIAWDIASETGKKATNLQAKYYNELHKLVEFEVENLILSNTVNLN